MTDVEVPSIVCPADQNVPSDANCQFTMLDYTSLAVAADNCDTSVDVTQSPAVGDVVSGTTTVTLTATDNFGNFSTCTFDLIVIDNTNPIITTCAPDVTELVDTNCEVALADYTSAVVATDNCDLSLTYNQVPAPGTMFSGHNTVIPVIITVTDDSGNSIDCSFNVTLEDNIDPTITCPANITQTADAGLCSAQVNILVPVTNDNCSVVSVTNDYTSTNDASGVYPVGTTTVTYTVIDIAGNTVSCSFDVTISDDEQPVIVCPNDVTQTTDAGVCEAAIVVQPMVATDNCAVATIVNDYNNTSNASDFYPEGTTVVNWTVTDINGNISTCSTTIIVTDNEQPVIDCPNDITQTADAGVCEALVTVPAMIATDNCAIAT
ncbi:MAG: HYR domain-containing protein, partial [Flavobacteriia bacterium]